MCALVNEGICAEEEGGHVLSHYVMKLKMEQDVKTHRDVENQRKINDNRK